MFVRKMFIIKNQKHHLCDAYIHVLCRSFAIHMPKSGHRLKMKYVILPCENTSTFKHFEILCFAKDCFIIHFKKHLKKWKILSVIHYAFRFCINLEPLSTESGFYVLILIFKTCSSRSSTFSHRSWHYSFTMIVIAGKLYHTLVAYSL